MMKQSIGIRSVSRSKNKGEVKKPDPEILLDEYGIKGDAHAGP